MAGWDLDFDVARDDEPLARDCFRVLRRTCARFHLKFSYYEERRDGRRIVFVLVFDGKPSQLGLASADFVLEMRAVSLLQRHSDRVPAAKRDVVVGHLTEYALAWGAWLRGELSPPDYLEAQHSLLTNLALDLAEGAHARMSYPELIKALRVPKRWEEACLALGTARNRVKHRGFRHEAGRHVKDYVQCVYSVSHVVTGVDATPRSAHMLRWEEAGERLHPALLYDRWGEPKRFTRY